jgi:monoterpene epsilon-lactone hydrolase
MSRRTSIFLATALTIARVPHAAIPPLPETLSPEIRAQLEAHDRDRLVATSLTVQDMRERADRIQAAVSLEQRKKYAVYITEATIDGISVRRIVPSQHPPDPGRVLLNLHGGGFSTDFGSLTENVPIAALTGIEVVAVRYRLAPEHLFPAAVEDALTVYRALLRRHRPDHIAVYGTSAGADLGPQLMMRLEKEGLPLPAALGVFSGDADWARRGDSAATYPLPGIDLAATYGRYAPGEDLKNPLVSPLHGALDHFPPTLCVSSSRDTLLSSTANFCRRLDQEGVDAHLIVFDGLPHAFWAYLLGPESDQAFKQMAEFLRRHLRSTARQASFKAARTSSRDTAPSNTDAAR